MKPGEEIGPLKSLGRIQKYGILPQKSQNLGKFTWNSRNHSNGHLTPVHEGYMCVWPVFWLVVERGVPEGAVKVPGGGPPMAWISVLLRLGSRPHSLATVSKKFKILLYAVVV